MRARVEKVDVLGWNKSEVREGFVSKSLYNLLSERGAEADKDIQRLMGKHQVCSG